jgi:hypothetical protein
MNNALETPADQIFEEMMANRRVVLSFPDNGNPLRIEEDIQVLL